MTAANLPAGPDAAAVRAALYENRSTPNGVPRNARAEELVSLAEATGDTSVLLDSLFELILAYEYSAERSKMFAPFARLLRMWDERPADFDASRTHRLHWMFKWVAGGMLAHPEIPLASIEQWHREMARRYRIAGHSLRPVYEDEMWLAHQLGDTERAERALANWQAAERDQMSNCEACEANGKGEWYALHGRDQDALDAWEPVLAGRLTCAEEPHRVLAISLLPLLRLGRTDEARAHHLRGYRLARGSDSLLAAIGSHLEFCALTGNEARGLEILSEHADRLRPRSGERARLDFLTGCAVLLRRLDALGLGDRAAPAGALAGPGAAPATGTLHTLRLQVETEIEAIARRFDKRNGTDVISRLVKERLTRQPLVESLPLGVKNAAVRTAPIRPSGPASTPYGQEPEASLDDLIAEARRLSELGHPGTRQAWARVEQAAAASGAELPPLVRAELAEERGFRLAYAGADGVKDAFSEAVRRYTELGRPAEAAVALSRAAIASAGEGDTDQALDRVERARATADELYAEGKTGVRTVATVRLSELRVHAVLLDRAAQAGTPADPAALEERVAEYLRFADGHPQQAQILDRIAAAERMRAGLLLNRNDLKEGAAALRRCITLYLDSGRPWYTADPGHLLARVLLATGDPEAGRSAAESALEHGGELAEPVELGHLHLLLADLDLEDDRIEEAIGHALQAAYWFDTAGASSGPGAGARLLLGKAYERAGRFAEAASVLESALPDLADSAEAGGPHHEHEAVVARQVLGRCLRRLGEHRESAEQFLLAADAVQHWENPEPQAVLASEAATSLGEAGMAEEAERAYRRAVELWRQVGDPVRLVRTLRARAWIAARTSLPTARALMEEAVEELTRALESTGSTGSADSAGERQAGDGAGGADRPEADPMVLQLRYELAETWDQTARLLADGAERAGEEETPAEPGSAASLYGEALELAIRAAEGFARCGQPAFESRIEAEILAAWIEADTGRIPAAQERMHTAVTLCQEAQAEELAARCRSLLDDFGRIPRDG